MASENRLPLNFMVYHFGRIPQFRSQSKICSSGLRSWQPWPPPDPHEIQWSACVGDQLQMVMRMNYLTYIFLFFFVHCIRYYKYECLTIDYSKWFLVLQAWSATLVFENIWKLWLLPWELNDEEAKGGGREPTLTSPYSFSAWPVGIWTPGKTNHQKWHLKHQNVNSFPLIIPSSDHMNKSNTSPGSEGPVFNVQWAGIKKRFDLRLFKVVLTRIHNYMGVLKL